MFIDLEKTFDWIPREVIRKGVPEYFFNGVILLYRCCKTAVSVEGKLSDYSVKVGVHQGSPIKPLLFNIVMDVLTELRDSSLIEFCVKTILLYVRNL